ncbi:MAG: DUF3343 domain-containing protein [Ruminococcaceae bacterium]|nr:DUF3343 domain-containing protein [Oscillospiraceae bacterium]
MKMTYPSSSLSGRSCSASLGSTTLAMKAQRALSAHAINASVIKINSSKTRKGCAYGISFDCDQTANVKTILAKENIPVREFL